MESLTPYKRYRHTDSNAVRAWLQSAGAVLKPEFTTPIKQLYYSARLNTWITIQRDKDSGNFVLALYHACPCNGR